MKILSKLVVTGLVLSNVVTLAMLAKTFGEKQALETSNKYHLSKLNRRDLLEEIIENEE